MRGAAIAFFIVAVVSGVALPPPGGVALPIALTLVGILFWLRGRPRRLDLNEEISRSLDQWMPSSSSEPKMSHLRDAFQQHFRGLSLIERDRAEGRSLLMAAIQVFTEFLQNADAAEGKNKDDLAGLVASATFHRAKSLYYLALSQEDSQVTETLLHNVLQHLSDFEKAHHKWIILVLPALALRIEARLKIGQLDQAEADQEILDAHGEGCQRSPEIVSTRRSIADYLWHLSLLEEQEERRGSLQVRGLIHYDAWLNQMSDQDGEARLLVASRHGDVGHSAHVLELLQEDIEDPRFAKSVGKCGLLDANRVLARAHLEENHSEAALRFYSVLMSVTGAVNPYLRDPQVLEEIKRAETQLRDNQTS